MDSLNKDKIFLKSLEGSPIGDPSKLSDIILYQEPIAHSDDLEKGILYPQSYRSHVEGVRDRALKCFDEMSKYLSYDKKMIAEMREILILSAEYHDLGKLDILAQETIRNGHKRKMLNHVDAGVSFLLSKYDKNIPETYCNLSSAILVNAHHIGLLNIDLNKYIEDASPDFVDLGRIWKDTSLLRDNKAVLDKYGYYKDVLVDIDEKVKDYTNRTISYLLKEHRKWIKRKEFKFPFLAISKHPMIMRLLLSCLVEGDHWDTSKHYGGTAPDIVSLPMRAEERMKYHIEKYKKFGKGKTKKQKEKNRVRRMIHRDCEKYPLNYDFYGLYAFPSYGKTLSGMYVGKRICKEQNKRGVIYVAPFNSILSQNLKELENFSVLKGERAGEVIGEHYQEATHWERSQESNMNYHLLKHYGILWSCPIEVASAVQLFETMAGNHPSKIRKLHQLAGKVIIWDEFHQTVPTRLLRQTLKWLKYLTKYWGCKVILMSGSPVKFWEIDELKSCDIKVGEILSKKTIKAMNAIEKNRVSYSYIKTLYKSFEHLARRVNRAAGPSVVVFNTLISAASFANFYRLKYGKDRIEYISTSLTPKDRSKRYNKIKKRLDDKNDKNWVLAATSCISTGVNFSFKTGFVENNSLLGTLQIGGRVNRNNEYNISRKVYVFNLDHNACGTNNNPAFNASSIVQTEMFQEGRVGFNNCTESICRELKSTGYKDSEKIEKLEQSLCYAGVARNYKVIPYAYKTVVMNKEIIARIQNEEVISYKEMVDNSVQIFFTKLDRKEYSDYISVIDEEGIPTKKYLESKIKAPKEINIWNGQYDVDFLGYMKEVLSNLGHNVNY